MSASTFRGRRVDSSRAGIATANFNLLRVLAPASDGRVRELLTAGNRRHDRDDLAATHRRIEPLQVSHVIVGHKDVHELVQVAVCVQQLGGESRVRGVECRQHVAQRGTCNRDGAGTPGERPQCGGDANGH